ncbi:hypothetical protein MPH_12854 [Macrophomina phaseolina MS6]|uniref:Uncharacterized protein n=1 Tax=Macrophomina phaseolina (strain MS6) TaxID=1126212 RepID=K2RJ15_MACPH|nr:hypothetical protein MPH_12854 [Macrophomina phaseolina MS6]
MDLNGFIIQQEGIFEVDPMTACRFLSEPTDAVDRLFLEELQFWKSSNKPAEKVERAREAPTWDPLRSGDVHLHAARKNSQRTGYNELRQHARASVTRNKKIHTTDSVVADRMMKWAPLGLLIRESRRRGLRAAARSLQEATTLGMNRGKKKRDAMGRTCPVGGWVLVWG